MLWLKHLTTPLPWCKKPPFSILVNIDQYGAMTIKTKTRILRLRRTTIFHSLIRIIVEIKANQGKLWFRRRKILVRITRPNKASSPILLPLKVTPLLSKKTRSRVTTPTWVRSNVTLVIKSAIMPISTLTKSQRTSVGLGDLRFNNCS